MPDASASDRTDRAGPVRRPFIGGFSLGLERAGFRTVGFSEVDPFCCRVLARHWPDVRNYGDIRTIDPTELPRVDLITFGSPCQGLSVAGQRRGLLGDERSQLFFHATRLVKALRPAFALWENVPGALSSGDQWDFAAALDALADAGALDIAWRTLDARWFGVPQRRRRVFTLVDTRAERAGQVLAERPRLRRHPAPGGAAGAEPAHCLRGGTGGGRTSDDPDRVTYALTAMSRKGGDPTTDTYVASQEVSPPLMAEGYDASEDGQGRKAFAFAWQQGDDSPHTGTGRGRSWVARAGDYTGALSTTRHDAVAFNHLQDPVSSPSVVPTLGEEGQAVALAFSDKPDPKVAEGYSPPLDRNGGPSGRAMSDAHGAAVRRLTPTECARLQGFPDDWNCLCGVEPYATAACTCPDGPRYASYGNAVCVPVVTWLGRRLLAAHAQEVAS